MPDEKTIEFSCKKCGEMNSAPLSSARRQVKCSKCGWGNRAPMPKVRVSGSGSADSKKYITGDEKLRPQAKNDQPKHEQTDIVLPQTPIRGSASNASINSAVIAEPSSDFSSNESINDGGAANATYVPSISSRKSVDLGGSTIKSGRSAEKSGGYDNSVDPRPNTSPMNSGGGRNLNLVRTAAYFAVAFVLGFSLFIPIYQLLIPNPDDVPVASQTQPNTGNKPSESADTFEDDKVEFIALPEMPAEEVEHDTNATGAGTEPKVTPQVGQPASVVSQPQPSKPTVIPPAVTIQPTTQPSASTSAAPTTTVLQQENSIDEEEPNIFQKLLRSQGK